MLNRDYRELLSLFADSGVEYVLPGMVVQIGVAPRRIDLLNRLTGVDARVAFANALHVDVDGLSIAVLGLDDLIENKRSTGRTQDLVDVERLEVLREQGGGERDSRLRD